MKTGIYSYITFSGNCREAMLFYKQCLGGRLHFQSVAGASKNTTLPDKVKKCVVHALLQKDELVLMGTDMVGDTGLTKGNAVSLMLNCQSERELRTYFSRLSTGGICLQPPEKNKSGILLGSLKDKYGHHWLLHFARKN